MAPLMQIGLVRCQLVFKTPNLRSHNDFDSVECGEERGVMVETSL